MPLFRRREPLHERLARKGGLSPRPLPEPGPPGWMETGVHGVPRARRWDAVVTVEAEGVEGDSAGFVALDDENLVVEEGGDVEQLAAALDGVVQPPYRAEATRRTATQWAVGVSRVQVLELPDDPEGDEVTLTVSADERMLTIDGMHAFGSIPKLEALGAGRDAFVVRARRIEGAAWEVDVMPL